MAQLNFKLLNLPLTSSVTELLLQRVVGCLYAKVFDTKWIQQTHCCYLRKNSLPRFSILRDVRTSEHAGPEIDKNHLLLPARSLRTASTQRDTGLPFCAYPRASMTVPSSLPTNSPPLILAIMNQKGGTGKTTTAVNLAAGLARSARRVLLVDLDPQGHATYGLGIDFDELPPEIPTVERLFSDERSPIKNLVMHTCESNLDLLPADIRLARAAANLHVRNFRESVLQKALAAAAGDYEYIILDCQPTLDVLAINALVAATRAIIPTPLAGHALRGLSDLLSTIENIKGEPGNKDKPDAFDWRVLLTMTGGQGEERQGRAWKILEPVQDRILTTQIRRNEAIERSQMEAEGNDGLTPVILQKDWSRGARDYRALVKEIETLWR